MKARHRSTAWSLAVAALVAVAVVLALSPGQDAREDPAAGLCEGAAEGAYLDFFWDDVRTQRPEVFAAARATCSETCPEAPKCAPVRSVAAWYAEPEPTPTQEAPQ